jgi:carbamate kinase
MQRLVIAIGGNMISDAKKKGEQLEEQEFKINATAELLCEIIKLGYEVIITHGNGPQVGSLLLQQQAKVKDTTELPLSILTALTQGQIGIMLQQALINELRKNKIDKKCVIIPTSVIVDKDDPAFKNPTKPVGPFYPKESYEFMDDRDKYQYVETKDGFRRIVPSPNPMDILEHEIIDELAKDHIVICVGGGGTPTILEESKLRRVDGVIDKDLASSLLALELNANRLLILTNIDGVYKNFNSKNQEFLPKLNKQQAQELLEQKQLGVGSMEPKMQAAINFAKIGETIITSPDKVLEALKGNAGTHIIP